MSAHRLNLQDHFLNTLRRAKTPVTVFLMKGIKLQGMVTGFDSFTLLLRRDGISQLVYKHSISTIVPSEQPEGLELPTPGNIERETLQGQFLASAARDQERVTLFLVNGVMLQGTVTAFDQFSLLLERSGQVQMVYKHAISTLQPDHALQLEPRARETTGESV